MPYVLLISVIIGITNIIPFFGPFIGAIPSAIIILFVSPIQALWFLVIVLVIQQVDGNIIGPKILGDSIGISAFWILFAILVAGKLFGLVGMIIGVPMFAVIYSIIKDIIEARLRYKGLPTETNNYMDYCKVPLLRCLFLYRVTDFTATIVAYIGICYDEPYHK